MSQNYKKFLRNSGLILSQPEARSTSHLKNINLLLNQKESTSLILLSGAPQSESATEDACSTDGSLCGSRQGTMKRQAAHIMSQIEKNSDLMENDPLSEQLRVETLREMPQRLTLKRAVKAKLTRAVSSKSKTHPIGFYRRFRFWFSILLTRLKIQFHEVLSGTELWYNSLKTIEGHFGSDVAAFFKFVRCLFIVNFIVLVISFSFVILPQVIQIEMSETNGTAEVGDIITSMPGIVTNSDTNSSIFSPLHVLTGEGFFKNSALYYGFYTNESIRIRDVTYYSIPTAYFFTVLILYLFIFIFLSVSMAKSYRKSFIETSGGLKNVYAVKIFCAWDFSVANENAAKLKSESILRDIKKLLEDDRQAAFHKSRFLQHYCVLFSRVLANAFVLLVYIFCGLLMYFLLDRSLIYLLNMNTVHLTGYDLLIELDGIEEWQNEPLVLAVIATTLLVVLPIVFTWIVRFEKYDSGLSMYITMLRTFILECIFIAVLVFFWLQREDKECWQTSFGQDVYRLIIMDSVISGFAVTVSSFIRSGLRRTICKQLKSPEFDISGNTLNLIYNEILFWAGFFFSPLLSLVIVVKLFLTFYLKKVSLLYNNVPSKSNWKAAQMQTLFYVLSFISLLVILITNGYIVTSVHTSNCGPFKGADYMYKKILEEVFHVHQGNQFWSFIMFLRKPGIVAGLLLTMCAGVYYLRAKSSAEKKMVKILREMLITEAKDKEYLLQQISFFTGGRKSRPTSHIDDISH